MNIVRCNVERVETGPDACSANAALAQNLTDGPPTSTIEGLNQSLAKATRRMGFDYYALVEHGPLDKSKRLLLLNYPMSWQQRFEADRLDLLDPVQEACRRRISGFCWSHLSEIITLAPAQEQLLRASRESGIGHGFTVPFHLPGARQASCSFAVKSGKSLPEGAFATAQLIALSAYQRAIDLKDHIRTHPISLSPRQRACVSLIAAGLTDSDIGQELGLSEETITKYLNGARKRNGLQRRAQLVAAALRDGLIDYGVLDGDS